MGVWQMSISFTARICDCFRSRKPGSDEEGISAIPSPGSCGSSAGWRRRGSTRGTGSHPLSRRERPLLARSGRPVSTNSVEKLVSLKAEVGPRRLERLKLEGACALHVAKDRAFG